MAKICTSIEQSKKLLELGVDVNIADMTYVSMKDYGENTYHLTVGKTDIDWAKDELGNLNWNDVYEKYVPAWSLSALLNLIPPYLGDIDEGIDFGLSKAVNGEWYSAHYLQFILDGSILSVKTLTGETAIDACVEMVCWLKENNHYEN